MNFRTREDLEAAKSLISPPGETLGDTLAAKGISQTELADRMGRPLKTINEIIQGKTAIQPETALQLERVLGISAGFWMEREKNYRLELAEIEEAEQFFEKKAWLKNFPISKMKEFGWIEYTSETPTEKFKANLNFFSVSNKEAFYVQYGKQEQSAAYRMSNTGKKNPYAVMAWLRRGELQGRELKAKEFSAAKFKEALKEIKQLMVQQPDNFFKDLQAICLTAGVKVVHTPCLPKTKLQGSTRWINQTPLIQLSNQYQRNDIFWFTFFHEAGHILKHGKKEVFVEGLEYTAEGVEKEEEADRFAIKYTFPEKEKKRIRQQIKDNRHPIQIIKRAAKEIETHPALILGSLAKEKVLHHSLGWTADIYKKIKFEEAV